MFCIETFGNLVGDGVGVFVGEGVLDIDNDGVIDGVFDIDNDGVGVDDIDNDGVGVDDIDNDGVGVDDIDNDGVTVDDIDNDGVTVDDTDNDGVTVTVGVTDGVTVGVGVLDIDNDGVGVLDIDNDGVILGVCDGHTELVKVIVKLLVVSTSKLYVSPSPCVDWLTPFTVIHSPEDKYELIVIPTICPGPLCVVNPVFV
jgi:hypothetical protein